MASSSAPGSGSPYAPAELTLALMLASARCLVEDAVALRSGVWQTTIGRELHGKVLGIVGYGGIGALVARYGAALGMHVLALGPCRIARARAGRRPRGRARSRCPLRPLRRREPAPEALARDPRPPERAAPRADEARCAARQHRARRARRAGRARRRAGGGPAGQRCGRRVRRGARDGRSARRGIPRPSRRRISAT